MLINSSILFGQPMPSIGENVSALVTFGKDSKTSYGDDDFSQTVFILVPKSHLGPFFIRIFDPEISGDLDEINGTVNTTTKFDLYGGKSAFSEADAQKHDPVGRYRSGNLIRSRSFGENVNLNKSWYSMGPFNPLEGEYIPEFSGYVFKLIIEGQSGDDGNLYKVYLSSRENDNYAIEGANLFTYEYSIRLVSSTKSIAHIYPFLDDQVTSIKQHNFDFDNDGEIRLYSVAKNGHLASKSGDNQWSMSEHEIVDSERGTSLDLQIVKKGAWNNDMVVYVTNQYDVSLPFYSIPIGGAPKYKYKIKLMYHGK